MTGSQGVPTGKKVAPWDFSFLQTVIDSIQIRTLTFKLISSWSYQVSRNKNAYNYLHNVRHATSGKEGDALYTTFLDVYKTTPLVSYKKSFLQCSQKSTNEYDQKCNLAYLINVFEDPEITNFFSEHDVSYYEDLYALNSMIQWIWRSAIRNGKQIHIYIPSQRMRELLMDWLNEEE